jgi:hypothetical protein
MNERLLTRLAVVVLCLIQIPVGAQGTPDPWYGRSSRRGDFEPSRAPSANFGLELPKGWQIVPGHGHILFTATEKTRNNFPSAAIVLEHLQLRSALAITPPMAEVELTSIQEREPSGQEFSQQIKQGDGYQFIFIQYTRPGLLGPDRVVQYSILAGTVLYRLICIAPAGQVTKYQSTFAHVAASFKATKAGAN